MGQEGFNPFPSWKPDKSPGEIAQKWAKLARMGLQMYLNVYLTEAETDALAKLLARFIAETKKKSGVDLNTLA